MLQTSTKLKDCCGVVEHLGGLHGSEFTVTAQPVMDTKGVSESV